MDPVFKSEMLYRREYLVKRMENLCHGRHLPVEVPAVACYDEGIRLGPLAEVEIHINSLAGELELGTVEPEVLCRVHKLQEMRDGKREFKLLEEVNFELLEARSGDSTNDLFQVSANTSEPKPAKVRKSDMCHDWRMRELTVHIT